MVTKKRIFSAVIILVLTGLSTGMIYATNFQIRNNEENIKVGVEEFLSKGSSSKNDTVIKGLVDIDNKKLVFFTLNSQLGYAELKNGLNNKYKVEYAGYSTNLFQNRVTITNKGQYLWIMGKNYNSEIKRIVLSMDGKDYDFDIPKDSEYFTKYTKVLPIPITGSKFPSETRIYDINGNDITNKVFRENSIQM